MHWAAFTTYQNLDLVCLFLAFLSLKNYLCARKVRSSFKCNLQHKKIDICLDAFFLSSWSSDLLTKQPKRPWIKSNKKLRTFFKTQHLFTALVDISLIYAHAPRPLPFELGLFCATCLCLWSIFTYKMWCCFHCIFSTKFTLIPPTIMINLALKHICCLLFAISSKIVSGINQKINVWMKQLETTRAVQYHKF